MTHDVAELEERSVAEWQAALARGELTSRDLVERYLQRIESLDHSGPMLHAVVETNPDALAIAASFDAERRAGRTRGPMHGIPALVKDTHAAVASTPSSRRRRPAVADRPRERRPGRRQQHLAMRRRRLPAITVPMGYVRGLPLGLTFTGRAWSEATLLKLAYAFEQASKVRKAPTFAESAELP